MGYVKQILGYSALVLNGSGKSIDGVGLTVRTRGLKWETADDPCRRSFWVKKVTSMQEISGSM